MKTRLILFIFVSLFTVGATAQNNDKDFLQFFDLNGDIAIQTNQKNALADTIAKINHRWDDIVWSRIVYRVIDVRDRQNNQLYFPVLPTEKYKSLLRLIFDETVAGNLIAYDKKNTEDIVPNFKKPLSVEELSKMITVTTVDQDKNTIDEPVFSKDNIGNYTVSDRQYEKYAKLHTKFVVQEIVFFNKHYSRMFSKIIGIAPIYFYCKYNMINPPTKEGDKIWLSLCQSIPCWYYFDNLRPMMLKQDMIPNGNEVQRMSYDEFFQQNLFSSYILGDSNMHDRMLLQSYVDNDYIVKEQKRIETELLDAELDLWEY